MTNIMLDTKIEIYKNKYKNQIIDLIIDIQTKEFKIDVLHCINKWKLNNVL